MFIEFLTENEFFNKYLDIFCSRFTIENLEMEDSNIDVADERRAIEFYNSKNALSTLLKLNPDKISNDVLFDIEDNLTDGLYFFSRGFRKTQVYVKKATKFMPPKPIELPFKMMYLLNNYYSISNDLDVFEREARFHIEFVRTQPFEDGNKRCAKIITAFNLMKQNKAPIIIKASEKDEYFDYIDRYDVEGMTSFLKRKSEDELKVMINLYNRICKDDMFGEHQENDISLSSIIKNENKKSLTSNLSLVREFKKISE